MDCTVCYLSGMRLLCAIILLSSQVAFAQEGDSTRTEKYFEVSFGQSVLFISESRQVEIIKAADVVVPTSAILFFTELRPDHKLKFPIYVNLPTENKRFLVEGVIIEEKARTTFGFGIQYRLTKFPLIGKTLMEIEAGPLSNIGLTLKDKLTILPIVAGRVKIINESNFVMYVGSTYSFGVASWGLLYGTGFTF